MSTSFCTTSYYMNEIKVSCKNITKYEFNQLLLDPAVFVNYLFDRFDNKCDFCCCFSQDACLYFTRWKPSWTMCLTHSTTCWSDTGAPSAPDWLHQDALQSATGSHSCLWPSNSITPPSECLTHNTINTLNSYSYCKEAGQWAIISIW